MVLKMMLFVDDEILLPGSCYDCSCREYRDHLGIKMAVSWQVGWYQDLGLMLSVQCIPPWLLQLSPLPWIALRLSSPDSSATGSMSANAGPWPTACWAAWRSPYDIHAWYRL